MHGHSFLTSDMAMHRLWKVWFENEEGLMFTWKNKYLEHKGF